jgi:hypothetical protein
LHAAGLTLAGAGTVATEALDAVAAATFTAALALGTDCLADIYGDRKIRGGIDCLRRVQVGLASGIRQGLPTIRGCVGQRDVDREATVCDACGDVNASRFALIDRHAVYRQGAIDRGGRVQGTAIQRHVRRPIHVSSSRISGLELQGAVKATRQANH